MDLVVVGSVAFDTIENSHGKVERTLGGSATYASLAASSFCPVKLVGVVGEDFTQEHRKPLESSGVDLEGLETVPGGKTFFWEGRYGEDPNERDTIVTELNVFENFSPKLPSGYLDSKWLFLGNIDPLLQLNVLEQFPERPKTACDTMNYWINGKPDDLFNVLENIEILIINDSEARLLSGERNLMRTARSILGMGPEVVVIKKGEHGAHLFTEDFQFIVPAFPLEEVIDPTGAGDSFAGGFMGSLAASGELDEESLRRAMVFGTVTASFTCEAFSVGKLEELQREDIQRRFNRLVELTGLGKD